MNMNIFRASYGISDVLQKSGIRGLGIKKLVYENNQLINCINKSEYDFSLVPCFSEYAYIICGFFTILSSMHVDSVQRACNKNCKKILKHQTQNRHMLLLLRNIPELHHNLGFIESWLSDNEIFFVDLLNVIPNSNSSKMLTLPWIGNDYSDCLLINRLAKQAG